VADNIFPRLEGGFGNIGPRLSTGVLAPGGLRVVLTITPTRIEEDATASLRVVVTRDGLPVPGSIVSFQSSNQGVAVTPGAMTTGPSGEITFSLIGLASGTTNIIAFASASLSGQQTDSLGNVLVSSDVNPHLISSTATDALGNVLISSDGNPHIIGSESEFNFRVTSNIGTPSDFSTFNFRVTSNLDTASNGATLTVGNPLAPTNYVASGAGLITVEGESALADGLSAKVRRFSHADQKSRWPTDDIFMHVASMVEKEIIFFRKGLPGPDEK